MRMKIRFKAISFLIKSPSQPQCLLFITFSPTVCSENCYHLVLVFKTKFQEGVDNGLRNKFGPTNVITVNAMRPEFQLGSLYDRRTDNLLPNQALWKKDSLIKKNFIARKFLAVNNG